jgi:cobalt-zinc-cadmium efflux system membrane fusion protein
MSVSTSSTVLLLSSDPLLEYAVGHMLPGTAYKVRRTDQRGQVGDLLAQWQPRAILVDLPEQSEQDVEFVRWLHGHAGVPVLVLARDPDALAGAFEPSVRVLPRSFQPTQLQPALRDVLSEPVAVQTPPPARPTRLRRLVASVLWLIIVAIGLLLILPMFHVPYIPNVLKMFVGREQAQEKPPETPITLLSGKDHFRLERETYQKLKIPPAFKVKQEPARRQIVLSGSLAFDPDWLGRVQSRFPGEVMEIGKSQEKQLDPEKQKSINVPLRYGSTVKKGQLMAVVWSNTLGEKKSELIDALVKLHLDERNLQALKVLVEKGAAADAQYRQAKNQVSADLNAIARARRTLQTWRVDPEEIKEVEEEAKRIIGSKSDADLKKRVSDNAEKWARIEIRAPFDGVVVERNVTLGHIVDSTTDLFKIADLSRLAVFANAYEEDQRILQQILADRRKQGYTLQIPWHVYLTSDPSRTELDSTGIERIGYIVDPTQKTNLAIGRVNNPRDELRVGQSVTALVDVPAPPDVVAVPAQALVEDGETSVLFVQVDPNKHEYVMKQVAVIERFNGGEGNGKPAGGTRLWAYVRSKLDKKQKDAGLQELKPGEMVVVGGAIELKAALEEVQARARRK